ncbi:hypothetical protein FQZ97_960210 [compost metagenome]
MLGAEGVLLRRRTLGLLELSQEKIREHRNAVVRIRLDQAGRVIPRIVLVDCVNDAEDRLVDRLALEDADHVAALLVARAAEIGARRRNDRQQWLLSCPHAGLHGVHQGICVVFVVLVHQGRMRACTIAWIADHRLELRHVVHDEHGAGVLLVPRQLDAEPVAQIVQLVRHHPRRSEHLEGLLLGRRPGIDLCPRFAIRGEQVNPPGGQAS